jgi:NAD(P)-dependent dehydrogenase (short-subunit alcohol dehydrogenase family)
MGAGRYFADDLLRGDAALVTGGGTGIGKAIAIALAECGASVAIASRRVENLEQGAGEIESVTGRRPLTVQCDIREPEQVELLVSRVCETLGRIDLLVNNAGGQFPQRAERFSIKGWNTVINNNLNGTWYVTQAAGKRMIAQGGGRIVNVIANYHRGMPGIAHTSAARAAVDNLSKTLAIEWGRHNIRVNSVAPGPIDTYGFAKTYYEGIGATLKNIPIPRFGTVEEVAAAVVFLASPASTWTTGATLDVGGGQHIWGDAWAIDPESD